MQGDAMFIEGYAFIEAVSVPPQGSNPLSRADVVLDAISGPALRDQGGADRNPDDLFIVRILSTLSRLKSRFSLGEVSEGMWFRVAFQHSPGDPPVWILSARQDYSGSVTRTNLVSMEPLRTATGRATPPSVLSALEALCRPPSALPSATRLMPTVHGGMHFVRVVDVGQASFVAIHDEKKPDSRILGYFDVGGPAFFHHRSFPAAFAEAARVPARGFVALSHWDFDHYSLAVTKLPQLRNLEWLAPHQPVGPNAARLQVLLGSKLKLLSAPQYQISAALHLHRGTGMTTDRNCSGYVLTVSRGHGNLLLPADCHYDHIPRVAKSNLSSLVVSHHGGAGCGLPPAPALAKGTAAVSYGVPNRYHHPNKSEITAHANLGWDIKPTCTPVWRGDVWL